eukprot:354296-Chlamydomonas_euryale.AAC.3
MWSRSQVAVPCLSRILAPVLSCVECRQDAMDATPTCDGCARAERACAVPCLVQATHDGLTQAEAEKRLVDFGPNKLPESTRNPVLVFLGYMWNPLSWAMEASAIIAICLNDWADFALIVGLLLMNSFISFYEESSADAAIKAVTAALAPKAKVLRDGKFDSIDAVNLVPGDIVVIKVGAPPPTCMRRRHALRFGCMRLPLKRVCGAACVRPTLLPDSQPVS